MLEEAGWLLLSSAAWAAWIHSWLKSFAVKEIQCLENAYGQRYEAGCWDSGFLLRLEGEINDTQKSFKHEVR